MPLNRKAGFAVLLLSFASRLLFAQEQQGSATSIVNVTVIDVVTGREQPGQTVLIKDGRIAAVAPAQSTDAALPGAVDGHGGYLIPGLWDMHIHVHDTHELPLYVANGVTGVRIMSGDRNEAGYRAELAGEKVRPDIYLASAIVDGSDPMWPGSIVVKKAADARRTVDEIKSSGADFIKVYDRIPREAYFALADQAKQQHIDFEGHVPDAVSAQEASAAGQRTMEHLQGIGLACSKNQEVLNAEMLHAQFFRQRLAVEAEAYRSFDPAKCQALFDEFRRNTTWQVPTLTVRRMWSHLDDSKITSDPRQEYVSRRSRDRWRDRIDPMMRRWNGAEYAMVHGLFTNEERFVGGMFRVGVPLMAGTDAMNPFCFPGFSLHDELALLVESGLTPLAALQAATINPAKFLGRSAELGSVEPGKIASLVLLRANPLADIHNTTQIEAVWLRGQYFNRTALTEMLDRAKQAAKH
jgi:hypothetical protein